MKGIALMPKIEVRLFKTRLVYRQSGEAIQTDREASTTVSEYESPGAVADLLDGIAHALVRGDWDFIEVKLTRLRDE